MKYNHSHINGFHATTMVVFAERLALAMERAKATRRGLSRALGVTYQAVSKVLDGSTKALTAENSARAARFLGVDMFWLATGEGTIDGAPGNGIGLHAVAHPPTDAWPFPSIPPARYAALPQATRDDIEEAVALRVKQAERAPPRKSASG